MVLTLVTVCLMTSENRFKFNGMRSLEAVSVSTPTSGVAAPSTMSKLTPTVNLVLGKMFWVNTVISKI